MKRFPFDSTRKLMSMIIREPGGEHILIAKGAPDVLLKRTVTVRSHGQELPLTDEMRSVFENTVADFAGRALRTLAVAYRPVDPERVNDGAERHEADFVLLGVHGIMDPPRPEVIHAVAECWIAVVRTVMITGDHAATAQAIAEEIGIKRSDEDLVFTGAQLDEMSDAELVAAVPRSAVFARVTPEHKLRIVKAFQANAEVVAMTGDGDYRHLSGQGFGRSYPAGRQFFDHRGRG